MLPGIGPKTLEKLSLLGITNPIDLLYHLPHRYIDFSQVSLIHNLSENNTYTISGTLLSFQNIFTKNHKNIQKAKISDNTGTINLIWFNQPYLSKKFQIGSVYSFAGTVSKFQNKLTIISPYSHDYQTGKIIPIYPETKGLKSTWFHKTITQNFPKLIKIPIDKLPPKVLLKHKLPSIQQALKNIHQPDDLSQLNTARQRIAIDETLSLLAKSHQLKIINNSKTAKSQFKINPKIAQKLSDFINNLPFKLTESQKASWSDIQFDLLLTKPCNRLLVGDVGSGKTVIAILASILASENKSISLLLAPTEILVQQHFKTISNFLPDYPIYLLTSHSKVPSKIPNNSIIIATHAALFHQKTFISKIGLLIIDEQHRFGVSQRSFLADLPKPPHTLTLTATPIPRTISLTFLNHLELSILKNPPSNRLPIKTFLVPNSKTISCYQWLQDHIHKTKQQAFIVCPFIDQSDSLSQVKSAKIEFEKLKKIFPNLTLELIHGQLSSTTKDQILKKFSSKSIDILVTTPIIEVGIDYPNATTIIIQSADRFGLSQLHQLRGRVGRGADQSYCYLFTESENQKSINRLEFLTNHHSGLEIAEYDLKTRGPGEVFSTLQHGFPSLKLADISDIKTIQLAKQVLEDLQEIPDYDLTLLTDNSNANFSLTN